MRKVPFFMFYKGGNVREVKIFGKHPTWEAGICLGGCNFDCKGCYTIAKKNLGREFGVSELINLFEESCHNIYDDFPPAVTITGGEPTLDSGFLLDLVEALKMLDLRVGLYTNGYLLNESLIRKLEEVGLDLVKLDLKALDRKTHIWYCGAGNGKVISSAKYLDNSTLDFYVATVFMPGLVGLEEVKKIAEFLKNINENTNFLVYPFIVEHAEFEIARTPTEEEMNLVLEGAKEYLKNVEAQGITYNFKFDSIIYVFDNSREKIYNHLKRVESKSKEVGVYKKIKQRNMSFKEVLNDVKR